MRANSVSYKDAGSYPISLAGNTFWSAYGRPDEIEIDCREGDVWITQEGDPRDIILHAGQQFRNGKRGLIIVQPFRSAMIMVNGGRVR